ncbi:hypothetical protein BX600DRAFT_383596 [Xylariales sp. PMI_506]|nr:hypothetical protein BX600DRAFT_383596 [Xylariales sp. PMI_506]
MGSTDTNALPTGNEAPLAIDPYALFEALTGRKIEKRPMSSSTVTDDFEEIYADNDIGRIPSPDPQPEDVHVGVINPFALVEALIGHELDLTSSLTARVISDVLQTDYDELFDLKYNSSLFAGLKLNQKERTAEPISEKDIKLINEHDLVTPDFSRIQKIQDLEKFGLKNFGETRVTTARMQNGKLHVVLDGTTIGKQVNNQNVTMTLNELALPFRRGQKDNWTPPNSTWEDAYEVLQQQLPRRILTQPRLFLDPMQIRSRGTCPYHRENSFDSPMQGALPNSWLIAAIFSVFWSDPSLINRAIRTSREKEGNETREQKKRVLSIKFHDKGGRNNASTQTVDVNYEVPTNNSSMQPVYCRSNDGRSIWPSLYEKAFAKWITGGSSERPDLTQLHNGDPVKAMAQINGKKPLYYFTKKHSARELLGIIRFNCVNHQTLSPMVAYTYATSNTGTDNLVANHAYSVLGWASHGDGSQYVILRNPFGVTEPLGITSYPGLMDRVEREFWPPACLVDSQGVLAIEATAFKEYFACLGLADEMEKKE